MKPKYKNIKMHLFYCLMQLLLECLDELKVTNPRMIELKNNMIEFFELLNQETKDTYAVKDNQLIKL